jgi:hypothetical protein
MTASGRALAAMAGLLAAQLAAAKDEATFVIVVRSPTAIVKKRSAIPSPPSMGAALHAGVAVDKAVAAATIVPFPKPSSELSELDREAVEGVAAIAANERCELLIWARAGDASLTAEAQRRATELQRRVLASQALEPNQVVTRITTHPGVKGVDVVVSALRDTAKTTAPAAAPGAVLLPGESGKRQIREAVQAAQPSIEACVGQHIRRRKLVRAESTIQVTVSAQGRVLDVNAASGDLVGAELDACLSQAATAWRFPSADGEYAADVPLTVIQARSQR